MTNQIPMTETRMREKAAMLRNAPQCTTFAKFAPSLMLWSLRKPRPNRQRKLAPRLALPTRRWHDKFPPPPVSRQSLVQPAGSFEDDLTVTTLTDPVSQVLSRAHLPG